MPSRAGRGEAVAIFLSIAGGVVIGFLGELFFSRKLEQLSEKAIATVRGFEQTVHLRAVSIESALHGVAGEVRASGIGVGAAVATAASKPQDSGAVKG